MLARKVAKFLPRPIPPATMPLSAKRQRPLELWQKLFEYVCRSIEADTEIDADNGALWALYRIRYPGVGSKPGRVGAAESPEVERIRPPGQCGTGWSALGSLSVSARRRFGLI